MRAQVWFIEFAIALIIVLTSLVIYLQFLGTPDSQSIQELHTDAVRISQLLISSGVPTYWNSTNVRITGITQDTARINETKISALYALDQNKIRAALASENNFYIYLRNTTHNISIDSVNGVGTPPTSASNVASVDRYLIYDGAIVMLRIQTWQ